MRNDDFVNRSRLRSFDPRLASDSALLGLCQRLLSNELCGQIQICLPSGRKQTFGTRTGLVARVEFATYAALWSCIRRGTLGFAEAYLGGEIRSPDIGDVFRFFIDNRPRLETSGRGLFQTRGRDRAFHRSRANTRDGSRRNIAAHYDLGNEFYQQWLDPGMTYSSGIYRAEADTLQTAQDFKLNAVLDAMALEPGHNLLEIGCGWGGLAQAAGERGADVTAITVSQQQYLFSAARIEQMSLSDRVTVAFQDYRDTDGTFDRIASIEMIEAVGSENWPVYFKTLRDRLKFGGCAVIQAITIREESYENYAAKPDFIQRYIFPGGELPTKTHLCDLSQQVGLDFEVVETFGQSYARTLIAWRELFEANWSQIVSLGFDERFYRLWNYYLRYCEIGFERNVIDVGLYRFSKT